MKGILFAAVAIVLRVGLHFAGVDLGTRSVIMLHLLLILLGIYFESNAQFSLGRPGFLDFFKAGMRAGVLYALVIGVFTWFFYSQLIPEVFTERNQALVEALEGRDAEEQIEMIETLFTPAKYGQGTFFGYFMISFCYSIIVALFHHKVLVRFR